MKPIIAGPRFARMRPSYSRSLPDFPRCLTRLAVAARNVKAKCGKRSC